MGKKKSTQLKPETKQLFDQHLGGGPVSSGSGSGPLFYLDQSANTNYSTSTSKSNAPKLKVNGKRKRGQSNQEEEHKENESANKKLKKSKKSIPSGSSSHKNEDAMDTSEDGVNGAGTDTDAPFLHDSDDEVVGYVERNKYQRSAHKQKQSKLENEREVGRLKRAAEIKAKKELAAADANSPLFDLWATSLEDDLKAGIVPSKNEKGFRTGRTQQTRFRHEGKNRSTDHLTPSVLPKQIHEGASFHPDHAAHQELLRIAYEKDEAERSEQLAMRARFTSHLPQVDPSSVSASPPSVDDDSWIDAPEPIKGPTPSHLKYSTTQRNRMARAAENRAKQEAKAAEKEFGKFVQRIPVLMAEWKKADKAAAKEKARIEELKKTQPDRKPKLGKYAEEEQFPDFALTEELPQDGSLRTLKPSSRIVEDQFARFQQRHLIETRKRVKPTKAMKGRVYDRFKDDQPPTSQTSTTNQ